ncbi:hypothetical protein EUGRSUZ_F00211 [Eucalyptus grandis]|uniref:Uncharacterized protein n=2 Tax=Eucalyptus grandis TaxID=71139 RepID=A0ACC3KA58_EUCGR|nr:hypothetical protein EUGRSUZ_F00211 [Eucalyptus grandis]
MSTFGFCYPTQKCCLEAPKSSWPELFGQNVGSVKATIEKDNPLVKVVSLPVGSVSLDVYCCNRVYLSIDENGNVTKVPTVG